MLTMKTMTTMIKEIHRCVSRAMSTAEKSLNSVSKIDRISRIVFPLTYIAINIVYWYLMEMTMTRLEFSKISPIASFLKFLVFSCLGLVLGPYGPTIRVR